MKNIKFAVGIPSYNEAETIEFVVKQVDKGLSRYFDTDQSLIVNLDSKSTDGTKEVFLKTKTLAQKKYFITPKGKGRAMLCFFKYCLDQNIPFIATVDADLKTITPEWVYELLEPIREGYDYTIPVYTRNRFEANITNHFAYPLILANYGIELRQPLGGEFGYSARFCEYLLKHPKYLKIYEYGIDIFISCCALFGEFNIKETYLGKKIHAPSFYHMEPTFRQVSESGIFTTRMHRALKKSKLSKIKVKKSNKSSGIDEFKYFPHKKAIPRLRKQLSKRFFLYKKNNLYNQYIGSKSLIDKIASIIKDENLLVMSSDLWTDYLSNILNTCYDRNFDIRNLKIISRITIPIYRWRAMTYWLSVEKSTPKKAENIIQNQAILLKSKMQ